MPRRRAKEGRGGKKGSPEGDFRLGTKRDPEQNGPIRLSRLLADASAAAASPLGWYSRTPHCSRCRGDGRSRCKLMKSSPRLQSSPVVRFVQAILRQSAREFLFRNERRGPDPGRQVSRARRTSHTWHRADSADRSHQVVGSLRLVTIESPGEPATLSHQFADTSSRRSRLSPQGHAANVSGGVDGVSR